jgi:hypothetical protein
MSHGDRIEAGMRAGAAETAFLRGLDCLAERNVALSDSSRASTYAPRMLNQYDLLDGFSQREMEQAMLSLITRGVLIANAPVGKGKNRHDRRRLARQFPDSSKVEK